jgi:hypothetical protein
VRPVRVQEGRRERDAQKPDAPEDRPEGNPRENFAPHHPPPVAEPDFTERQRTDHERRRL